MRSYDPLLAGNALCITCTLPNWEEPNTPGRYSWKVDFPAGSSILVLLGWCTEIQGNLDSDWSRISFALTIDGYPVDLSPFLSYHFSAGSKLCNGYRGILTDWERGNHRYIQTLEYAGALFDGLNTYQAGVYVEEFSVTIR